MKNIILAILGLIISFFAFTGSVNADSAPPKTQVTFYFENNGEPVNAPVNFEIKCYGKSVFANSEDDELLEISHLSDTCLSYGCAIDTFVFETYRTVLEYCNLEGDVNGEKFIINDFYNKESDNQVCSYVDFDRMRYIEEDQSYEYYRETEEYDECVADVYREFYPEGDGHVIGEFLCNQEKELIPTTLSTEQNGPCYHYGYQIEDGICYEISQSFFDCTKRESEKMAMCDQYLENVTEELAKGEDGYVFEKLCSIKIEIPYSDKNSQEETEVVIDGDNQNSNIIDILRSFFQKIFSLFS
jgi:hypothetical protein